MLEHGKGTKTDNNREAFRAKVKIRQMVMAALERDAAVFDAFAGSGEMFSAVWKDAASYVGCDQKRQDDSRLMFCADNRRVMRAIDLLSFNLFDLDSYGSPWVHAIILADRRKVGAGELVGVVLTEGSGLSFRVNIVSEAIGILAGVRSGAGGKNGHVAVSRSADFITNRAIVGLAKRMNCDIVKRWQAEGKTGAAMRYIGLVLRGKQ